MVNGIDLRALGYECVEHRAGEPQHTSFSASDRDYNFIRRLTATESPVFDGTATDASRARVSGTAS
jgi:hypothetical protein